MCDAPQKRRSDKSIIKVHDLVKLVLRVGGVATGRRGRAELAVRALDLALLLELVEANSETHTI